MATQKNGGVKFIQLPLQPLLFSFLLLEWLEQRKEPLRTSCHCGQRGRTWGNHNLSENLEKSKRVSGKGKKKKLFLQLSARLLLAGLIAFYYKFPPQPIKGRSVAVRLCSLRTLKL